MRITDRRAPNEIRVLRVDPSTDASIDVAVPGGTWPSSARTSTIAKVNNAIAAVNGDFDINGHPIHPFVQDGRVLTSGYRIGDGFALAKSEDRAFVGDPRVLVVATNAAGTSRLVRRWNQGGPKGDELAAFTEQGGSAEEPPNDGCYARLSSSAPPAWTAGHQALRQSYVVESRGCQFAPVNPRDRHDVVLASQGRRGRMADWIQALPDGGTVRLTWQLRGWPDVLDEIGGAPLLLRKGKVVAPASCGSYFCNRNPRTGIGVAKNGDVLIMTVDGRQNDSIGVTLPVFARLFRRLGGRWAVNMDGGGSTTMVARLPKRGMKVVNDPATDGGQRPTESAILVLRGEDGGEFRGLGALSALAAVPDVSVGANAAARAALQGLRDPGSTGGMLLALANGGLGPVRGVDPLLLRMASRVSSARLRATWRS